MSTHMTCPIAEPILTVEFAGLIAFAVDRTNDRIDRIYALVLDPSALLPGCGLCRHATYLIAQEEIEEGRGRRYGRVRGLETVGSLRKTHFTIQHKGNNLDLWNIEGLCLALAGLDDGNRRPIVGNGVEDEENPVDILDLDLLGVPDQPIERHWIECLNGSPPSGIAAIVTIETGVLEWIRASDPWILSRYVPGSSSPDEVDPIRFMTNVRWKIYGTPYDSPYSGIRLQAADECIGMGFLPGTTVSISNLCKTESQVPWPDCGCPPDEPEPTNLFRDVLAYYELIPNPPVLRERSVFYRPGSDGTDTRPGSDPCSPLTGNLQGND